MSNNKYRILIVEDDRSVASLLRTMLDAQQYETLLAGTCAQGLMMLRSHVPDLVLLDLGLPDRDGVDFIQAARQDTATPILVLSARSTEKDKVTALDSGANDYITKPFSTAELLARIRAALRYSRPGAHQGKLPESRFQLHDLLIEYENRTVTIASQPVHLTQTEFNILVLLAQHAGKLLTYPKALARLRQLPNSREDRKRQQIAGVLLSRIAGTNRTLSLLLHRPYCLHHLILHLLNVKKMRGNKYFTAFFVHPKQFRWRIFVKGIDKYSFL